MNKLAKLCVMVMAMGSVCAQMNPKIQYDEAQAYVTLPVNVSTNVETFLTMGQHVASALADKPVSILLKGYVTDKSSLRETIRVQYILQRLERRMQSAMPGSVFATDVVETVLDQQLLPAWRVSTANTIPSAYIAIIIQPIMS